MIDGVVVKQLKRHSDERGYLVEMLRSDDDMFVSFGQSYIALNYPGIVRAWHYHEKQEDIFVCVKGMIKAVLYDSREGSPTHGEANEFFMGDDNPMLLRIPIGVMHGYKTIGTEPSLLVNFPTLAYNHEEPDEFREPYDSEKIPYDWEIRIT